MRIEIVVGFVVTMLEANGSDIVPATSGALDMAGKVIVDVLIALMVMVLPMVMMEVIVLATSGAVCASAVIVSIRVTVAVNVVVTSSALRLIVAIDVLKGSIDLRTLICSDICAAASDFVVSQSSPSDVFRMSGYQLYSSPLTPRLSRLLRSAQTNVMKYPRAKIR